MTSPKETKQPAVVDPKEIQIHGMSGKEFRIILLRKFSELHEKRKTINAIRKTKYEQSEKFDKKIAPSRKTDSMGKYIFK